MILQSTDHTNMGQANVVQAEAQPSSLRCPFCNTDGVEIMQVQERRPRQGGLGISTAGPRLFEGAIYEFQARCPKCKKKYRQTCPDNLLPVDFLPPA
jgi:hypothetical protein